jgi:hypothetical protein
VAAAISNGVTVNLNSQIIGTSRQHASRTAVPARL